MKYDMIFGNQGLFSVAPTDAAAVWVDEDGGNFYYKLDSGGLHSWDGSWHNCVNVTDDICFSAMRRIIQEPKRWTVEDKKAGRLPEVGAEYNVDGCIVEHLGVGAVCCENIFYFKYPSGACGNANERSAIPIETPDEKAERLRSEWINDAINAVQKTDNTGGYEAIYDALLSGALSVPTKGGE